MDKLCVALVCCVAILQLVRTAFADGDADGDANRLEPQARIAGAGAKEVIPRIPHQVALQVRLWNQDATSTLCGGALVSPSIVLTAARCLDEVTRPLYEVRVTAGALFVSDNVTDGETSPAKNVFVYPQWNNASMENDIGIVVTFPFRVIPGIIEPIRLPSKRAAFWPYWGWSATSSGWSLMATAANTTVPVLRATDARILKNIHCKLRYSAQFIRDTNICTSAFSQKRLCKGDEGGPLFVKELDGEPTLLGIASFKGFPGMPCKTTSLPSVYTRVGGYLDWIHEKTSISLRKYNS